MLRAQLNCFYKIPGCGMCIEWLGTNLYSQGNINVENGLASEALKRFPGQFFALAKKTVKTLELCLNIAFFFNYYYHMRAFRVNEKN